MMSTKNLKCALATALLACGHGAPSLAQNGGSGSTEFAQALARNYQALSAAERAQGDNRDADTYAARAAAASAGEPTAPDQVELRQAFLKDKYVAELSQGRQRLVTALDGAGRAQAPVAAAYAQASYDCWLEQAAEDLQPDDIAACRDAFMSAITDVEAAQVAQVTESTATPPAPTPPATPTPPETYMVFFDFDKSEVTQEARRILESVEADTKGAAISRIVAVGHADTSGGDAYNLALSRRRAEAVAGSLRGLDVRADTIETEARGEREPLVATGDGVREPQNRRVEISIQR